MTSILSHKNPPSFVVEFTRLRKEGAQHGVTDAVNVEEEITLQSKCKNPGKHIHKISPTDTPSSSREDNEDINYITSIAVESANICSIEPFPKGNLYRNAH